MGTTPAWQAILFAIVGSVGFLIILSLADFVTKHNQSHRDYTEYIVFALLGLGLAGSFYFLNTFRQFYPGVLSMFKRLEWYHWLWSVSSSAAWYSESVLLRRAWRLRSTPPLYSASGCRRSGRCHRAAVKLFMKRADWLGSAFTGIVGLLVWFDLMTLLSTIWSVYWQWTFYKSIEYGVDVCMLAVTSTS